MPRWTPMLYTAGSSSRYGFVVLASHDREIAQLIGFQPSTGESGERDSEPQWILGTVGDRVFFGRWGWIAQRLGAGHPAAVDRVQRELKFFLGYSAALGTRTPAFDDLRRVDHAVTDDLRRFTENDGASRFVANPPEVPFEFSAAKGNNSWDRAADQLDRGRACAPLIVDARGSVRSARTARDESFARERAAPDASEEHRDERKIEQIRHAIEMSATAKGALAAVGAAVVAALVYALKKH